MASAISLAACEALVKKQLQLGDTSFSFDLSDIAAITGHTSTLRAFSFVVRYHSDRKGLNTSSKSGLVELLLTRLSGLCSASKDFDHENSDSSEQPAQNNVARSRNQTIDHIFELKCAIVGALLALDCHPDQVSAFLLETFTRRMSPGSACSTLHILLQHPLARSEPERLLRLTRYVLDRWWYESFNDDKCTSSSIHMMDFAESCRLLQSMRDTGVLGEAFSTILDRTAPAILLHNAVKLLSPEKTGNMAVQSDDVEDSIQAVLAMSITGDLCPTRLQEAIKQTLETTRESIQTRLDKIAGPQASIDSILTRLWCVAALSKLDSGFMQQQGAVLVPDLLPVDQELKKFLSSLGPLRESPEVILDLSASQAKVFLEYLRDIKTEVFPQTPAKDKYLKYIPATWTMINACVGLPLPPSILLDIMTIGFQAYLVDEYMERTVSSLTEEENVVLSSYIERQLTFDVDSDDMEGLHDQDEDCQVHLAQTCSKQNRQPSSHLLDCARVLEKFTAVTLQSPRVLGASAQDLDELRFQLGYFLTSHLRQLLDNARFESQLGSTQAAEKETSKGASIFQQPQRSYSTWVHTTALGHSSAPFCFAFFACVLGNHHADRKADCFDDIHQKFLAHRLCTHLSTFSRMYNDFGSIPRDKAESNLNSINFPDFHGADDTQSGDSSPRGQYDAKQALRELAEYERRQAELVHAELQARLDKRDTFGGRLSGALRLFVTVTYLYGDLYAARDITKRVK